MKNRVNLVAVPEGYNMRNGICELRSFHLLSDLALLQITNEDRQNDGIPRSAMRPASMSEEKEISLTLPVTFVGINGQVTLTQRERSLAYNYVRDIDEAERRLKPYRLSFKGASAEYILQHGCVGNSSFNCLLGSAYATRCGVINIHPEGRASLEQIQSVIRSMIIKRGDK